MLLNGYALKFILLISSENFITQECLAHYATLHFCNRSIQYLWISL